MIEIFPGHKYRLKHLDGDSYEVLQFVDRGHGHDQSGTNNQEVIRALISRVKFLNTEVPWEGNEQILYHLRMALVLHEARHLIRLVECGKRDIETIRTGFDGHFILTEEEES